VFQGLAFVLKECSQLLREIGEGRALGERKETESRERKKLRVACALQREREERVP
jgi:hypothetical protein